VLFSEIYSFQLYLPVTQKTLYQALLPQQFLLQIEEYLLLSSHPQALLVFALLLLLQV
jgi:hypothetical protein